MNEYLAISFVCPHSLQKLSSVMCKSCFDKSREEMRKTDPNWNDPTEDGRAVVEKLSPGGPNPRCFFCGE